MRARRCAVPPISLSARPESRLLDQQQAVRSRDATARLKKYNAAMAERRSYNLGEIAEHSPVLDVWAALRLRLSRGVL